MSVIRLLSVFLIFGAIAFTQQSSAPQSSTDSSSSPETTTVRGCLNRLRGNYLIVENRTNLVYALRGVGDKLEGRQGQEVEVKGQLHPGSLKTGVRSTKAGSNPADTIHGVDGVPLQIANVSTDVKTIAKKCKSAEDQ